MVERHFSQITRLDHSQTPSAETEGLGGQGTAKAGQAARQGVHSDSQKWAGGVSDAVPVRQQLWPQNPALPMFSPSWPCRHGSTCVRLAGWMAKGWATLLPSHHQTAAPGMLVSWTMGKGST